MEDSVLTGRSRTLALVGAILAGLLTWWVAGRSDLPTTARSLAAVTVVMAVFWSTQPIPIAATSLLPIAVYPLLGIAGRKEVCAAYGDSNVFLYLGGFIVALGLERWNLHRRMALHVILAVGSSPRRLVYGMAFATAFLSMWISNTATTLLMLPIALSLVQVLEEELPRVGGGTTEDIQRSLRPFAVAILLAVAFGATCGGLATFVGTPTNTTFRGFWIREFVEKSDWQPLSAADWMTAFVPLAALMLMALCFVTTFRLSIPAGADRLGRDFCEHRLAELGRMSSGERLMLMVFVATAGLWILREPLVFGDTQLLPGWDGPIARWLVRQGVSEDAARRMADDSTVAVAMALLLFLLRGRRNGETVREPLMDWETIQRRVPWGVLLLFGGGFAMADAFGTTGLGKWLGGQLGVAFSGMPVWAIIAGCCALVTLLSEFTSNVATVSTVLPVLAPLATSLGVDPRTILIPAAASASFGFMLPVATPPNAIVYGTGRVPVRSMMKYGLALDVLGVILITLFGMFVVPWAFHVEK